MTSISKSEMDTIAGSCDDIEDGITGTGTKVTGEDNKPDLEGWQLQKAIGDVNKHWKDKADHSGRQWKYYASAVRATASDITATDEKVAFTFPKVGNGEADIPVPFPFSVYSSGQPPRQPGQPPLPLPPVSGN